MAENQADFTLTFRRLCDAAAGPDHDGAVRDLFVDPTAYDRWAARWREQIGQELQQSATRQAAMRAVNPAYIPRNHLVEDALTAATTGDLAPFEELVGALLPCYWIYWEVGKALVAAGSPNPLYQRWIDKYASEEFGEAVRRVLDATYQATTDLPETRRAPIRRRFVTASRYEWMFWDAAWTLEEWPIG